MDIKKLFERDLPLQHETAIFLFASALDIFLTYIVLWFGGMEANPIANYFLGRWGFRGMLVFKLCIVATVCLIAQLVATRTVAAGKFLLIAGTILTGMVVVYSIFLHVTRIL